MVKNEMQVLFDEEYKQEDETYTKNDGNNIEIFELYHDREKIATINQKNLTMTIGDTTKEFSDPEELLRMMKKQETVASR